VEISIRSGKIVSELGARLGRRRQSVNLAAGRCRTSPAVERRESLRPSTTHPVVRDRPVIRRQWAGGCPKVHAPCGRTMVLVVCVEARAVALRLVDFRMARVAAPGQ